MTQFLSFFENIIDDWRVKMYILNLGYVSNRQQLIDAILEAT